MYIIKLNNHSSKITLEAEETCFACGALTVTLGTEPVSVGGIGVIDATGAPCCGYKLIGVCVTLTACAIGVPVHG